MRPQPLLNPEPSNQFHRHLDECQQCREHPFDLCPEGAKALNDAVRTLKGVFARTKQVLDHEAEHPNEFGLDLTSEVRATAKFLAERYLVEGEPKTAPPNYFPNPALPSRRMAMNRLHKLSCDEYHQHQAPGCCDLSCWCRQPPDPRYPYTHAADLVRQVVGPEVSRSDASKLRQVIAEAIGMPDEDLAMKMADYYKLHEQELSDQATSRFMEKFKQRGYRL